MQNSIRKGHHIEHSSTSSSHITRATLKSLFRELPKTLWLDSVGIGMQITFQVLCKCEDWREDGGEVGEELWRMISIDKIID